jgi:hypothetical protein
VFSCECRKQKIGKRWFTHISAIIGVLLSISPLASGSDVPATTTTNAAAATQRASMPRARPPTRCAAARALRPSRLIDERREGKERGGGGGDEEEKGGGRGGGEGKKGKENGWRGGGSTEYGAVANRQGSKRTSERNSELKYPIIVWVAANSNGFHCRDVDRIPYDSSGFL